MTIDETNTEPVSPEGKSAEGASPEAAEPVSVPDEFKSQGKMDPEEATSLEGDSTGDKTEDKEKSEEKPEKKEPEKAPEKKEEPKSEPLTDKDRDKKLFGDEGDAGKLDKGEEDLSGAQAKFFDKFEKAQKDGDAETLSEIDSVVENKPKLAEQVSESLFDLWSDKIKSGDSEFIGKLEELSNVAPNIADAVASKFWRGEKESPKFFEGSKDLFDFIGFETKPKQAEEVDKSGDQKTTVLELDLKLSDVAHGLGQSFEEFKKTSLYDQFIDEASKFTKVGMSVDEFWGTIKKAVLSDTSAEEAKKKGAEEEKILKNASLSSPSGAGDDKGGNKGDGFSSEDSNFLDALGVDKDKIANKIAKNKK